MFNKANNPYIILNWREFPPLKLIFLLICCCLLVVSCESPGDDRKKITIGFSQCTTGDAWRRTMHEEMLREISLYQDYEISLIVKDAHDSNEQQIEDIRELVAQGIDILMVSPNEAKPLTPVVEEVYNQGIPVIVIDRKIASEKFTAYVGANNLLIGKEAGRLAVDILKGKGKVAEVAGLEGATPAVERSKGFRSVLSQYPEIQIVASLEGEWLPEVARGLVDSLFDNRQDIDLVFAQNDPMAYGVYRSAVEHAIDPYIVGIDGLNIAGGGLEMVMNGYIDGTVYYPTGGDKAVQVAVNILNDQPFDRFNYLSTFKIDASNARTLTLQGEQIQQQYEKIDLQRKYIGSMNLLISRQQTFLLLLLVTIGLLVMLVGSVIYILYKKNYTNKVLDNKNKTIEQQNTKITLQRDEVIKALKIAEEATEAKLSFFTSLSHEFRTTLSMISLPLNDLVNNSDDSPKSQKLLTIQQNTNRLIRLAEEILDFRKLEKSKSELQTVRKDLVPFVQDITHAFEHEAKEKHITLSCKAPEKIEMDYDAKVLEKVLFNLISNAIKYTPQHGSVSVNAIAQHNDVLLQVQDTGVGIAPDQIPRIFDLFYRVPQEKDCPVWDHPDGSGLGLALCKELIHLHRGTISVTSSLSEGSLFSIRLPRYQSGPVPSAEEDRKPQATLEAEMNRSVLIVEDNSGLLNILSDIVGKYFTVMKASNGKEGLDLALQHHPDLIISDVFMPEMDGIELCGEIKKNPVTFQIPVILLTAIDSQQARVSSFDIGADDYLTKPINEHVLVTRARNLMDSREKLKSSLGKYQFLSESLHHADEAEQEFMKACITIIHQHISDESFHLDELASEMNMSRSSLYRKIKKLTGMKGVDFLKKTRLQYAAKLLLNEDKGVNEVAWLCGFSDVKYFSKCFAREFDHNPSKFKSVILSSKDIKDFI